VWPNAVPLRPQCGGPDAADPLRNRPAALSTLDVGGSAGS